MFKLEIKTDNAAFTADPAREIDRILNKLGDILTDGSLRDEDKGNLFDVNGNRVGQWSFTS